MDVEFFRALLVLEPDFVEVLGSALLAAPALKPALSLIRGQTVGWHLIGVINSPGDDRTVRVPLQKLDNDFLSDPRNVDRAPFLPRPVLGNSYPTGRILVGFVVTIPMKMDFHPGMFVGVNFFASRTDDDGRLRPLDDGLGRQALGPELLGFLNCGEIAGKKFTDTSARGRAGEFSGVGMQRSSDDEVLAVLVATRMVLELERMTSRQPSRARLSIEHFILALQFIEADIRQTFTFGMLHILAWVIVNFILGLAILAGNVRRRPQR